MTLLFVCARATKLTMFTTEQKNIVVALNMSISKRGKMASFYFFHFWFNIINKDKHSLCAICRIVQSELKWWHSQYRKSIIAQFKCKMNWLVANCCCQKNDANHYLLASCYILGVVFQVNIVSRQHFNCSNKRLS